MYSLLVFEPMGKRLPSLVLTLKEAGMSCTVAGTHDEALVWLNSSLLPDVRFDFFILHSLQGFDFELRELVLAAKKIGLLIICICRETCRLAHPFEMDGVVECFAANLTDYLKKIDLLD